MPANKIYVTGTVPANKNYVTGTVEGGGRGGREEDVGVREGRESAGGLFPFLLFTFGLWATIEKE